MGWGERGGSEDVEAGRRGRVAGDAGVGRLWKEQRGGTGGGFVMGAGGKGEGARWRCAVGSGRGTRMGESRHWERGEERFGWRATVGYCAREADV